MKSCEFQLCSFHLKRILLITSNVGSLFGENSLELRRYWMDQIKGTVNRTNPIFFALHLQESGGKNYRLHSREMTGLVDELQKKLTSLDFAVSRCFLDIDFELAEEFTALSSLFFVHRSAVEDVFIYNFQHQKLCSLGLKSAVIVNGLNKSGFVRKEKFKQSFWAFRWARKGFLHTRWKIGARGFDFINIHLFHDESNLNFIENPSEYSVNRQKALQHTLQKFEEVNGGTLEGDSNCFLFGDFNFRLNLVSFIKKLTNQTSEREVVLAECESVTHGHSVSDFSSCGGSASPTVRTDDSEDSGFARMTPYQSTSSSEVEEIRSSSCEDLEQKVLEADSPRMVRRKNSVIEYFKPMARELLSPDNKTDTNNWVLRIGKKRFEYCEPNWLIEQWETYREDDCEPKMYQLKECRISFAPTYPWSEEPECPSKFMNTRPPAWCDRVLFNENASTDLVQRDPNFEYASFGDDHCIGDHKPVMLLFSLQ